MKKLAVLAPSIFLLLFVGLSDSNATHKKNNPKAGHGGGGGDVPGNFTVTVYLEVGATFIDVGSAVNVVGDSESDGGLHRAGVGAVTMGLNLDRMETTDLVPPCDTDFGMPQGRFGISTARHDEDGPLTFVAVSFSGFRAGVDKVSYWVAFDNGNLNDNDLKNWLPGPQSGITMTGTEITLSVTKGPTKKGPCNGLITQNWEVVVFNEAFAP